MTSNPDSVLVLDADLVPSLTITRSLGRKGVLVDVASNIKKPITSYSKYAHATLEYPNPLLDAKNFVESVLEIASKNSYDLVIPATERTLIPLANSEEIQKSRIKFALPPLSALSKVLDKSKTLELARDLAIPFPKSITVSTHDELEKVYNNLIYPVVLKPVSSISTTSERRIQLSVSYAFSADELRKIATNMLQHCPISLQEYVTGIGCGIELIADKGVIKYAFQHERIHEVPLTGGGSSLRKSTTINTALLDASKALINALKWHGVAMVEFKYNPVTGEFWLMEINGRFWGSLPLAYVSGADFPYMLYKLYKDGNVPTTPPARINIYCRKLSSDLYWYEQVIRKNSDNRIVKLPSARQATADLLKVFDLPHHYFDIQSLSDIKPGLIDIRDITNNYLNRFLSAFKDKSLIRSLTSRKTQQNLFNQLKISEQILILCYGNINRSALAEKILKNILDDKRIHITSGGFHSEDGRPADPVMIELSTKRGIDLSHWRSTTVTKEMLDNSDLILVMDINNYKNTIEIAPDSRKCTYLFGLLNEPSITEIPDPYNKTEEVYLKCIDLIESSCRNLKTKIQP